MDFLERGDRPTARFVCTQLHHRKVGPGIVAYLSDMRLLHTFECGEKQCRLVHVGLQFLFDGRKDFVLVICNAYVSFPDFFSVVKLISWPHCENPRTADCEWF